MGEKPGMKSTMTMQEGIVARFGATAACLALCMTLFGCASDTGAASTAGPMPAATRTASTVAADGDETDLRKRARLRLELAASYFDQGQTNVALDELKQVLALDPSFADAYNLRGLIYMRLNDTRLAEESFRRALALSPGDAGTLHNYGWFLCQQGRYPESLQAFSQALANPMYLDRAKTFLAQGLCEARSGDRVKAERSLTRAYEMDAGNPVTGYNLALLLYGRGELTRAQFYIRRLNNSEQANSESLWLGIKVERRLNNPEAMRQLGDQLKRRFPQAKETGRYERGEFDD
jgi:type IV pilus assembly protein PilF